MRPVLAFSVAKLVALLALVLAGCGQTPWPAGCTPGDHSCLPCTDPQTTNPACAPFPADAKKKDASGGEGGATGSDRR